MPTPQADLFEPPLEPPGLRFEPCLLDDAEQAEVVRILSDLPFAPFEFHGWLGARRVVSFGGRYDFGRGRLEDAPPLPVALEPLRETAAGFGGMEPDEIAQTLVTEYAPGAGIGWHRDRPQYGRVVGVSFLAPCTMRFRQKDGATWRRRSLDLPPGSAYLLDGPARWEWEHSITPMSQLRYSLTFRTLRNG